MLQQTTHNGDTHIGYFNMAVFAVYMYIRNSVSYNVVLYGSAGLEVIVVSLSKGNFKLCVCVCIL